VIAILPSLLACFIPCCIPSTVSFIIPNSFKRDIRLNIRQYTGSEYFTLYNTYHNPLKSGFFFTNVCNQFFRTIYVFIYLLITIALPANSGPRPLIQFH
jgi:hypothetical protein